MTHEVNINGTTYTFPDNKPELLLPAGDLEKAKYAFAFGADAVYAGVPMFALRAKENKFTIDEVKRVVEYARSIGKKVYLTTNIYPHNSKLEPMKEAISEMVKLHPDAFIVSDPGIVQMFKEYWPEEEVHLSVQQNNVNWMSAKFWGQNGVKRIILARELSLKEMTEIVTQNPELEFEAFIHGAICMSYSGRCLLSSYFSHRDPNQGVCTQSCRWQYKLFKDNHPEFMERDARPDPYNYKMPEESYVIEEKLRKGEFMPVDEDIHGTYIFNSRDMCTIDFLEDIIQSGVCSLKVEGRNKSVYYTAVVARAYRKAIDALYEGQKLSTTELLAELMSAGNRSFIPGFLTGNPGKNGQYYNHNNMQQTHIFAGKMTKYNPETNKATFEAKNKIIIGDVLEILTSNETIILPIDTMYDANDEPILEVHPGAGTFTIKLPENDKITSEFAVSRVKGQQKRNKA